MKIVIPTFKMIPVEGLDKGLDVKDDPNNVVVIIFWILRSLAKRLKPTHEMLIKAPGQNLVCCHSTCWLCPIQHVYLQLETWIKFLDDVKLHEVTETLQWAPTTPDLKPTSWNLMWIQEGPVLDFSDICTWHWTSRESWLKDPRGSFDMNEQFVRAL